MEALLAQAPEQGFCHLSFIHVEILVGQAGTSHNSTFLGSPRQKSLLHIFGVSLGP